jgi:hypothetical protein
MSVIERADALEWLAGQPPMSARAEDCADFRGYCAQ